MKLRYAELRYNFILLSPFCKLNPDRQELSLMISYGFEIPLEHTYQLNFYAVSKKIF
jgi:hypothetical protein